MLGGVAAGAALGALGNRISELGQGFGGPYADAAGQPQGLQDLCPRGLGTRLEVTAQPREIYETFVEYVSLALPIFAASVMRRSDMSP